jgi:hypothetical protein
MKKKFALNVYNVDIVVSKTPVIMVNGIMRRIDVNILQKTTNVQNTMK